MVPHSPSRYVYDTQRTPPESPASDDGGAAQPSYAQVKKPVRTISHVSKRARERARLRTSRVFAAEADVGGGTERMAVDEDQPVLRSTMGQRAACPGSAERDDETSGDEEDELDSEPFPLLPPSPTAVATSSAQAPEVIAIVVIPPTEYPRRETLPELDMDLLYDPNGAWKSWVRPRVVINDDADDDDEVCAFPDFFDDNFEAEAEVDTDPSCEYTGSQRSWADMMDDEDEEDVLPTYAAEGESEGLKQVSSEEDAAARVACKRAAGNSMVAMLKIAVERRLGLGKVSES